MATYYTNSNNQRDSPMSYSRENIPVSVSYAESQLFPGNMMVFSNSALYSDGNSQSQPNCMEIQSVEPSDSASHHHQEVLTSLGGPGMAEHQEFTMWRPMASPPSLQGQGLSLSLGTQIIPMIQMNSIGLRSPPSNPGSASLFSKDEQFRNAEYVASGNSQISSVSRSIPNTKYLKAAQELLDDVVNVRKALKQPEKDKIRSLSEKDAGRGSKDCSNVQESNSQNTIELSHPERQDFQNKLSKLLSMLDEVDRKYKQYYHQMQIVVSSFDVVAGRGAAKPYTALALQTISSHFRCLRDAISGEIVATRKNLGENDSSDNSKCVGITRLRYVDQQIRQQRALQQLGMIQQHAWRPQRGLPESSVSVLRAWLFEHFLHPYPKDSDKIMLARQTGLSRSQVSNWFINARVRLWKPMVEEMYKEEFADADMDSNSLSEAASKAANRDDTNSEERVEEDQTYNNHSTRAPGAHKYTDQSQAMESFEARYGQGSGVDGCSLFHDQFVAAGDYNMGRFGGGGGGVSLTLGLQHREGVMSGVTQHSFMAMRDGGGIYEAAAVTTTSASSSRPDHAAFEYVDPATRQHRFSSNLLHDFVA